MTLAVSGGGGFIGSRLVRALVESGRNVRTLLGPTGADVVMPPASVERCFGGIDDAATVAELVSGASTVVHLAGPPSVAASFQAPAVYARVHTGGTANLVEACIRGGVARLVLVSSAEVYGAPPRNPVDEDAPYAPRSPYAAAKIGAEAFVRAGAAAAGFEAVICRPFLVYGPGMASASLIGSLIDQARRSQVIEVRDPRPVRDYCYVDDLVIALMAACEVTLPEPVRVYNLGSGTGLSVYGLAERILAMRWGGGTVRVAEAADRPRAAEILELVSDCRRAARELGWRAETPLDRGLAEMLRSPLDGGDRGS